jgi:Flp pilus assembly protein TadG
MRRKHQCTWATRRWESGQAFIELVVLAPVFFLLLVGLLDFGRYAYDGILLANAASAGARYGSQNAITAADTSGMQSAALADAQSLTGTSATARTYCQCTDGTSADCNAATVCASTHRLTFVQVTTTGSFSALISYPGITNPLIITRSTVMQVSP